MTGYGRAEFSTPHGPVRIEIKSTNLKFFELSSRMPEDLVPFTESLRKIIQRKVKRGRIVLAISSPDMVLAAGTPHLNESLARQYHRILKRMNHLFGLGEKITLSHLVRLPDVVTRTVSSRDIKRVWAGIQKALMKAIDSLDRSRLREGSALARDMAQRSRKIAAGLKAIEYKIAKKAAKLSQDVKTLDVTEEIVRMKSHVNAMLGTLNASGESGRKIDFIAQEMIRETNTIGAKANNYAIAEHVIHMKSELEKIREQAQNVE